VGKRGRWKLGGGKGRKVVRIYMDVQNPVIDAKTAAALCGPNGAAKYRVKVCDRVHVM
jgi:hypothetical protein